MVQIKRSIIFFLTVITLAIPSPSVLAKPVVQLSSKALTILKGDVLLGLRIPLVHVSGDPRANATDEKAMAGISLAGEYMLTHFVGLHGTLLYSGQTVDKPDAGIKRAEYDHLKLAIGARYHGWNYDRLKICLGALIGYHSADIEERFESQAGADGTRSSTSQSGIAYHAEISGRYLFSKRWVGFVGLGYGMGLFTLGLDYKF